MDDNDGTVCGDRRSGRRVYTRFLSAKTIDRVLNLDDVESCIDRKII